MCREVSCWGTTTDQTPMHRNSACHAQLLCIDMIRDRETMTYQMHDYCASKLRVIRPVWVYYKVLRLNGLKVSAYLPKIDLDGLFFEWY